MTNVVTLDFLRAKADEKYSPYQIDMGDGKILTIRNPMRIEKEGRDRVTELKTALNEVYDSIEEDEDGNPVGELEEGTEEKLHAAMLEILNICADDDKLAEELNDQLRVDIGFTQIIFYDWLGKDEVGEASSSAD